MSMLLLDLFASVDTRDEKGLSRDATARCVVRRCSNHGEGASLLT